MARAEARVSLVPLGVDAEAGLVPPAWARGGQPADRFWYFANAYGEPWVARLEGDALQVSGAEIAWRELRLPAAEAEARIAEILSALPRGVTLDGVQLGRDEALWLAAVLGAAFLPPPRAHAPAAPQGEPPNSFWGGWVRRIGDPRRPS